MVQTKPEKSILIVGAGAIGGTISVILQNKGFKPHVIVRHPEEKMKARKQGFRLIGHHGKIVENITTFLPSDLVSEKYDIVLLATKATDTSDAAKLVLPHLHPDSMVVSLQNGICEDDIASIVGRERTIGCVTGFGATMIENCCYEMTSGGEFIIGNLVEGKEGRLEELKQILEHIVPVKISENIYGALYSKLIINSCVTTMGGICGSLLGKMLTNDMARDIFINIIKEAMDVANAMKIKVEPYGGKLDFYKFLKRNNFIAKAKRQWMIRIIGMKFRRLKSSTLQSLERGRPTEIDWFNGYIVRKAKKFGLNAGVNQQLVDMIKEIEQGRRKITIDNFEEIIIPDFR